MSKNPLDSFTDKDLREICEAGCEWQNEVEPILRAGTAGKLKCPGCQADAAWTRERDAWQITCHACGWDAVGSFGNLRANQ